MITIGIEATAHTFGIGILKEKKILANAKHSYITEKGGIIPIEAAKHHQEVKEKVLEEALAQAKINLEEINLVSVSISPGLPPCLSVGLKFAKQLASQLNVPIIGAAHTVAHLEIGKLLTEAKDPVLLYVSGANTQVIAYEGNRYRIFGETLDMGCGNFIDAFARYIDIGFPGGPKIEQLALESKNYISLPYVVKGMDVSFSGLLTNLKQKYDKGYKKEELSYSLQETAFAMLLEVAERALAHCQKNELLLGGGVCCNSRLKEMAQKMCEERGAKCFIPPNSVLQDNGVMISWLGYLMYKKGIRHDIKTLNIKPYERTDEVVF